MDKNTPNYYKITENMDLFDVIFKIVDELGLNSIEAIYFKDALKYVFRSPAKGDKLGDLKKARHMIDMWLEYLDKPKYDITLNDEIREQHIKRHAEWFNSDNKNGLDYSKCTETEDEFLYIDKRVTEFINSCSKNNVQYSRNKKDWRCMTDIITPNQIGYVWINSFYPSLLIITFPSHSYSTIYNVIEGKIAEKTRISGTITESKDFIEQTSKYKPRKAFVKPNEDIEQLKRQHRKNIWEKVIRQYSIINEHLLEYKKAFFNPELKNFFISDYIVRGWQQFPELIKLDDDLKLYLHIAFNYNYKDLAIVYPFGVYDMYFIYQFQDDKVYQGVLFEAVDKAMDYIEETYGK